LIALMIPALRVLPFPSEHFTNGQKFSRRYYEKQSVCSLLCRDYVSCRLCLGVELVKLRAIRAQATAAAIVAKRKAVSERFRKGEEFQWPFSPLAGQLSPKRQSPQWRFSQWPGRAPSSGGGSSEDYRRAARYLQDLADRSGGRLYDAKLIVLN
jgi:hypothetical protein